MTSILAALEVDAALDRKHEIERVEAYLEVLQGIGPLLLRLQQSRRKPVRIKTRLNPLSTRRVEMDHWFIHNAPSVTAPSIWRPMFENEPEPRYNFWLREDGVIVVNTGRPRGSRQYRRPTRRFNPIWLGRSNMRWLARAIREQDLTP